MTETTPDYAELIEWLEGVYRVPITDGLGAVGAGEEPDNPDMFVRKFETPPIQKEAATALRTLLERNAALKRERDEWKSQIERVTDPAYLDEKLKQIGVYDLERRVEAAEAKLAEAMKVIGQIDNALNDQFAAGIEEREGGSARRQERLMKSGEELRRAARKFLKENGNGE